MFAREKVIFGKGILADFHNNLIWQIYTCIRQVFSCVPCGTWKSHCLYFSRTSPPGYDPTGLTAPPALSGLFL